MSLICWEAKFRTPIALELFVPIRSTICVALDWFGNWAKGRNIAYKSVHLYRLHELPVAQRVAAYGLATAWSLDRVSLDLFYVLFMNELYLNYERK